MLEKLISNIIKSGASKIEIERLHPSMPATWECTAWIKDDPEKFGSSSDGLVTNGDNLEQTMINLMREVKEEMKDRKN